MPSDLERSLFQTVCWFSLFEYPLTVFEMWKWMWKPAQTYTLADVHAAVSDSIWLKERLSEYDGQFALARGPAVADLVRGRREKHADAVRKYAKLKRSLAWFARIPGIEGIAAVNTLAWFHTRPESDIDLFIVVRPGAIWSTRLLAVVPFILFGRRPHGARPVVDPFCFSFFVTTDVLDFAPLCLEESDPYLAYWTRSVMPVFDRGGVFDGFGRENGWVTGLLPHVSIAGPITPPRQSPCKPTANVLERLARRIQLRRLPVRIRELANKDSRVVISDQMLKFHDNDRREEYCRRFNATQTFYGS